MHFVEELPVTPPKLDKIGMTKWKVEWNLQHTRLTPISRQKCRLVQACNQFARSRYNISFMPCLFFL